MDSKKENKISEIVRLQQIIKKWKKIAANSPKNNNSSSSRSSGTATTGINGSSSSSTTSTAIGTGKSSSVNKFLKKTLSFSDSSNISNDVVVPKGFLAICVGKELKRFIIPTEYLGHQAFGVLLREAEEEFGFQQEGVLKIPCDVSLFQKILKMVQDKSTEVFFSHDFGFTHNHHHLVDDYNYEDKEDLNNNNTNNIMGCFSPDCELPPPLSHHSQLCR